ncbi:unnamed protein product [Victoria cruziana]
MNFELSKLQMKFELSKIHASISAVIAHHRFAYLRVTDRRKLMPAMATRFVVCVAFLVLMLSPVRRARGLRLLQCGGGDCDGLLHENYEEFPDDVAEYYDYGSHYDDWHTDEADEENNLSQEEIFG